MWNNSFPGNTCLNDPSSYWIKPGDNTKVLWEHSRRCSWLQCFDIIYFCWTTWQLYKDVFHLFLLEHAHTDTSCEKRYNIVCMVAERLDATPKPPEIQPNIIFILVLTKVFLSLFFFSPVSCDDDNPILRRCVRLFSCFLYETSSLTHFLFFHLRRTAAISRVIPHV